MALVMKKGGEDMEEAIKRFMALTLRRQDRIAAERDAVIRKRSHGEKAAYHTGVEHGLILAGRHIEAAEMAADLEDAFGGA